jgi:septum formation protein
MRLILASASPRRAELLTDAGFDFTVEAADVDETPRPSELPDDYVVRVARDKAFAVETRLGPEGQGSSGRVILAADTVVSAGRRLLGKPADAQEAREMLELLSGQVHSVLTGVVLRTAAAEETEVVSTDVRFITLSDAEIDWYVGTGEPSGKAGAYAIQGRGARFVDWIEGSWSNVVGLPVATVYAMLRRAGAGPLAPADI